MRPWWPEEFGGSPDSSGEHGERRYAYFANALRLFVKRKGTFRHDL